MAQTEKVEENGEMSQRLTTTIITRYVTFAWFSLW